MTDLASLVLAVDSTSVPKATASLDGLTAAGARAEVATVGLGAGSKTAAAQAAAMAAAAQASARAATGMATGFKASSDAMRVNTIAMRETLVVARELSRGNFTRIPGSLTLLAQGIGSQGGLSAFGAALAQTLGLVKTVQNAELAEQAVNAAASASAIESAAARAAAAVTAADTELALAEAQLRVTAGTSAEDAAQVRLAEAHEAVAVAAGEAAVAENALATAYGRADEAAAASIAQTTTTVSALGVALSVVTVAAGLALAGFEGFKGEVKDSGELDQFAEGLRLTTAQIEAAGGSVKYLGHNVQEITGLTITWGDVANGTFNAVAEAAGMSSSQFKGFWREAFLETAQVGVSAAQVIAGAFAAVGSIANNLKGLAIAVVAPGNPLVGASPIPSPQKVGQDALKAFEKQFAATGKFFHETLPNDITAAGERRLQKLSDSNNPPKPAKPKKTPRNAADDELAKLDAQIAGQNALSQAYLTSDSAVIKAEADEKAMTLAVEKHANAAQTAALKSKELALAIATISVNGAKEINNLTFEASSRKAVNDQIAAGLIPAGEANNALALENQLRPLVAAQAIAEGAAKTQLATIIRDLTKAYADNQAQISRTQALQQEASNDNEIAKLQLETQMIGASNKERAVALAQLEAMQKLQNMPGLSAQEQQDFVQSEINKAAAGIQTPFQQWAASVPQTAAAVNDALQTIETHGFDNIASAIADVVTGTKSLQDAFKSVAQSIISDIIQMTIKMLIFRAVSSIFGGSMSSMSQFVGPLQFANGAAFSGGNIIPFASGGIVSGPSFFPMSSGKTGMMGEAGPEAIMPLSRDGSGRLGVRAANNNTSGPVVVEVRLNDDKLQAQIVQGAGRVVLAAAPGIAKAGASAALRVASRPKLVGR